MSKAILAIDAGTTSVRALVVRDDGVVAGKARDAFPIHYPGPGLVEQDPEAMWRIVQAVVTKALSTAGLNASDLAAIGVTSQRASCMVWERATGHPLSPLVSWQDLRGVERSQELQEKGFGLLPQSAACKLESVLDSIDDGRARMGRGELAWGNLDAYLVWRLSHGAVHATDPSQACATGYYDYITGDWDEALLEAQGLTTDFFPKLVDTYGELGHTSADSFGASVRIGAIVGDQQSAAIAQACAMPGDGKVTFGTSATCNVHTGSDLVSAAGTYPLVLMHHEGHTTYCVEGMVITAGAVFDWLSSGLGLMDNPDDAARIAATVDDSQGVFVLPALQGIGSPHADPSRRAMIGGLTRGSTQAHIVRAAMEGIAFRVREMLDKIYSSTPLPRPPCLRVDGGASMNAVLMQIQADVLGIPVERMAPAEASAFGAAVLAGRAAGVWGDADAVNLRGIDATFEPRWNEDERDARFLQWREDCGLFSE